MHLKDWISFKKNKWASYFFNYNFFRVIIFYNYTYEAVIIFNILKTCL